jgi:hypothetical protein
LGLFGCNAAVLLMPVLLPKGVAISGAPSGRLPKFLIIGAMKSGTTTLDSYLRRHPLVFMCTPKEPGYFSRDEIFSRGVQWYAGLFAGARSDQVSGEASTCYSRSVSYPAAAERLAQALPAARLIYIMRHPVERAYSHYVHRMTERYVAGGCTAIGLQQALDTMPSIIRSSCYVEEISRYLAYFRREQLLLITLEELRDSPARVLSDVQQHIGVPVLKLSGPGENLVANPAAEPVAHRYATRRLDAWRETLVGRAGAAALPGRLRERMRRWMVGRVMRSNTALEKAAAFKRSLDPLTREARAHLLERLDAATCALQEFLGKDLSAWRV